MSAAIRAGCRFPLLFLLVAVTACAVPDNVRRYVPPGIGRDEAARIAAHGFRPEHVGFVLHDLDTGERVAGHRAREGFIPASVAKLPTVVAALEILGHDHRFRTEVLARGEVHEGVLKGDLILRGGGDPLLSPADLLSLAAALRDAGLRRVEGRFLFDDTGLARRTGIEPSQPGDAGYNPGIGALSLDFNRVLVRWRPHAGGIEAFAASPVDLPGVGITEGRHFRHRDGRWLLPRALSSEGAEWLPVKDPGKSTAAVFRSLCRMHGVNLPEPRPGAMPAGARLVARHESPPLATIARAGLEFSNNLIAEMIGLAASRAETGEKLSLKDSAAVLSKRLGVSWSLANHSGLSVRSRVTPADMAQVVRRAHGSLDGFVELLPSSAWKESFDGRFAEPATALRVWAKTGTMNYASGMAGVLFAHSGRRLAFALFVTDFDRRRHYDADRDTPGSEAAAEAWRIRAKALEEGLVTRWVLAY